MYFSLTILQVLDKKRKTILQVMLCLKATNVIYMSKTSLNM